MNVASTQSLANAESAIIEGAPIHTKASTAVVRSQENRWARLDGWAVLLMLIWGVGIVIASIRQLRQLVTTRASPMPNENLSSWDSRATNT